MSWKIKSLAGSAVVLLLAGCVNFKANYMAPLHGEIASDHINIMPEGESINMPENAPSISQGFHPAPKIKFKRDYPQNHAGIDIVARPGTPVMAAAEGVVIKSFFEPLFGNQISILHKIPDSTKIYKTNYYHMRQRFVVEGDRVQQGQQIGQLGSTGLMAAFPHLHYEVREDGPDAEWTPLNPHLFWSEGRGQVTCFSKPPLPLKIELKTTYPVQCLTGY